MHGDPDAERISPGWVIPASESARGRERVRTNGRLFADVIGALMVMD
jgi:hypothetical protein